MRLSNTNKKKLEPKDVEVAIEHILKDEPSYACPLSHQLMIDPVNIESGEEFERKMIERWLTTNNTCPLTNATLNHLTVNKVESTKRAIMTALEHACLNILEENPEPKPEPEP